MSLIDAHAHVWTADFARYPLAPGYTLDDVRPASFTLDDFFRHARPHGVERVNLVQSRFHGFDNSFLLDTIAVNKTICVGTAVIDVHQPHPDRQMAELAEHGIRAFRIHPRLSQMPPERWLQPAGYQAMFAAAARLNLGISCLIDPDCLPELERLCDRYGETPVIIDHLCRIGADGVLRSRDVDALCAMSRHPRAMVKVGGFYPLGAQSPPYADLVPLIERVVEAFGAQRCMWESDCPYQVQQHNYLQSVNLIQSGCLFLSERDKISLLQKTAEAFYFAPI